MNIATGKRELFNAAVALAAFVIVAVTDLTLGAAPATDAPQKTSRYRYQDDALVYAELATFRRKTTTS
jgi:hypothetical protein